MTAKRTTNLTQADRDEPTDWIRMHHPEPILLRDPLAELLGMVAEGEPLAITFPEVAKVAGHACPAVSGAYRATQLALEELYPDSLPIRSAISVVVGGKPSDHGIGPMANVIRTITGAADETGFSGLAGVGGRDRLLAYGEVEGPGRSFRFSRTDRDGFVTVSFDPSQAGVDPGDGIPFDAIARLANDDLPRDEAEAFWEDWHDRVDRILNAPAEGGPFTVKERA